VLLAHQVFKSKGPFSWQIFNTFSKSLPILIVKLYVAALF